ncbi:MAG: DNA polymerase I, partial [Muribaculaceae bacterium]|nr:DNA polymerase I [Muribaculaceae bacterium]
RKENPSHIAVCFDPKGGHTFRHEVYPEYKAGRDAQPEDITLSIPYIKRLLQAYHIPAIEADGYEADDIIGTLSRRAEAEGYTTYMMTPDKDYGQLVTNNTFMYRPSLRGQGFEIRGVAQICERYGINRPAQVIDMLALEGDKADNIPGCPGVGEKTASKLISEWDTVENLIAHTSELKGAIQRKIQDNADAIIFSKQLATIKTDVPIDTTIASLRRREPDTTALLALFDELEFKTMAARLKSQNGIKAEQIPPQPKTDTSGMGSLFDIPESVKTDQTPDTNKYQTLHTSDEINGIINQATAIGTVGITVYATGQAAMTADIHGIAIAIGRGDAAYIELPADPDHRSEVESILKPLLTNPAITLVSHDVKRDYLLLKREGIE